MDPGGETMKLRLAIAAIAVAAIAAPTIASAETTIIKKHGDRDDFRGARNELRIHRDFDRDRDADFHHGGKTVIIKKHGDRDY
jgi:Ni/Co efflux regulator RcnB